MIIPWQQLEPSTLEALLESYILREGTDYGTEEHSLEQKLEQLQQQLHSGDIVIVYSELHESVTLLAKSQLNN